MFSWLDIYYAFKYAGVKCDFGIYYFSHEYETLRSLKHFDTNLSTQKDFPVVGTHDLQCRGHNFNTAVPFGPQL